MEFLKNNGGKCVFVKGLNYISVCNEYYPKSISYNHYALIFGP